MANMKTTVLLVEDEPVLAEIIQECLKQRDFSVIHSTTVDCAFNLYINDNPQIIVMDVMLPDGSGFNLAKKIRSIDRVIPIIFLTSKSMTEDVIMGFDSGGNDYLRKPFSLEELIVRIKVQLSNNRLLIPLNIGGPSVNIGEYSFQYPKGVLNRFGSTYTLTTRESEILHLLVLNRDVILSRMDLLQNLWGNVDYFSGRSLDVFITKLRKYLKDDPSVRILNIRGQGYKMVF